MSADSFSSPVMLFDGRCLFCSGVVNLIMRFERTPVLRFGPLQSKGVKPRLSADMCPRSLPPPPPLMAIVTQPGPLTVLWGDRAGASDAGSGCIGGGHLMPDDSIDCRRVCLPRG